MPSRYYVNQNEFIHEVVRLSWHGNNLPVSFCEMDFQGNRMTPRTIALKYCNVL